MHCETLYHIYNHANGVENLFKDEMNYYQFIERVKKYIAPITRIYAYCLMPNHFHLLVETKEEKEIEFLPKFSNYEHAGLFLSKQFSNCFSSYTQSFNYKNKRKGSLFIKNFNYKAVGSYTYLNNIIPYIHFNPVKHGFCEKADEWKFSSYLDIMYDEKLLVRSADTLKFFDSKEQFLQFHEAHQSSIEVFEK